MNEDFRQLCLVKVILQNVLTCLHETRGHFLQTTPSNKFYRFAACKQYIWFVYKRLGKGNCRVIPSCVAWKIRETFLEDDGLYISYTEEWSNFHNVLVYRKKTENKPMGLCISKAFQGRLIVGGWGLAIFGGAYVRDKK